MSGFIGDSPKRVALFDSYTKAQADALFDGTSENVPEENVKRDANGTFKVGTPTEPEHPARKSDLDMVEDQLLGVGQSWQNVTSIRSSGVTYTNNTGRPIEVQIYAQASASTDTIVVDGMEVNSIPSSTNDMMSCIVPVGATYIVPNIGQIYRWVELR